jgi:hypothetical protein
VTLQEDAWLWWDLDEMAQSYKEFMFISNENMPPTYGKSCSSCKAVRSDHLVSMRDPTKLISVLE